MPRKSLSIFLASILSIGFIVPAISAPKEGSKCTSVGKLSGKLTCVSLDGKKFWYEITLAKGVTKYARVNTDCYRENLITRGFDSNKKRIQLICKYPTAIQGSEPPKWVLQESSVSNDSAFQFISYCQADPNVPKEWAEYQKNVSTYGCIPPYRYVKQALSTLQPKTQQSSRNELLSVSECKLTRGESWNYFLRKGLTLNPNIVVQIVPFATKDYPSLSDPRSDWKQYIDYIAKSLSDMTDVPSNYQFRIAPKYFTTQTNLADYKLSGDISHGEASANPNRFKLISDVLSVADSEIDFSGADYVFFFSPLTVSRDVLGNHIAWGQKIVTGEKTFEGNSYITSYISDFKSKNWIPREPFSFIHEMMHIFNSAEDYYGDVNYGGTDVGTGNWGNMSGGNMEHLIWDKWNVQMISDNQVRCASKDKVSINWIKPSTITGAHEKLLMIPITNSVGLVVESIRASGFNYKIPKVQQGAIVYRINTVQIDDKAVHGDGVYIQCPKNKICNKAPTLGGFRMSEAVLKEGESVESDGIRITVVESGDFGDVVKIERII
jgi:hypothetical protein